LAEYIINLLVHIGLVTNTFLWPKRYNDDTFVISNIRQIYKYSDITWARRYTLLCLVIVFRMAYKYITVICTYDTTVFKLANGIETSYLS